MIDLIEMIPLPLVDLQYQTVVDKYEHYLAIYPEHIQWRAHFLALEVAKDSSGVPDESLPWHEHELYYDESYLREFVVGVNMAKVNNGPLNPWKASLIIRGASSDLDFYFRTKKACCDFYEKIKGYTVGYKTRLSNNNQNQ